MKSKIERLNSRPTVAQSIMFFLSGFYMWVTRQKQIVRWGNNNQ